MSAIFVLNGSGTRSIPTAANVGLNSKGRAGELKVRISQTINVVVSRAACYAQSPINAPIADTRND